MPKAARKHHKHKVKRHERFAQGVYGEIQKPIISKNIIGLWEPPSYYSSRNTIKYKKFHLPTIDYRCFYSSVVCLPVTHKREKWNHDSKVMPWMGTKDHLVPIRRGVPESMSLSNFGSSLVWTSNVVNQTIGLAPLPIRLKIREWLTTTAFDRNNLSVESGANLRWIIIDMLEEFRIKGRFPWSRNSLGLFWYPSISNPLMDKWYKMEKDFLTLNETERDQYIKNFCWYF